MKVEVTRAQQRWRVRIYDMPFIRGEGALGALISLACQLRGARSKALRRLHRAPGGDCGERSNLQGSSYRICLSPCRMRRIGQVL